MTVENLPGQAVPTRSRIPQVMLIVTGSLLGLFAALVVYGLFFFRFEC